MRFYLHDRNNVPEREKIIYYSNAEGDLIKEDLPQNLKSAKETLFREGSGKRNVLAAREGDTVSLEELKDQRFIQNYQDEYISIENSFSSDNQEYLNLDFEPHMFFEYGVDDPNVSLAYNKAVRNALALKLTKEFEDTILIIERSLTDTDADYDINVIFLYPATGSKKGIFDLTEILDYYLYDMKLTKRTVQLVTENSKQVYWMWVPKILKMEDVYNILEFENKNLKEYGGYKICGDAENSKDTDILSDERIHALINHVAKKYKWESSPEEYDVIFKL